MPRASLKKRTPSEPSSVELVSSILVVCAIFVMCAPNVSADWIPWLSTKDLIEKRLNQIHQALLARDVSAVKDLTAGSGKETYIGQELAYINSLGITNYQCVVQQVHVDRIYGIMAYVDFQRNATVRGGSTVSKRLWKVFRRVGNDWKLLAVTKKRRGRDSKKAANQDDLSDEDPIPNFNRR